MIINTVAPPELKFVRIIGSFAMSDVSKPHVGKVGKLISHTDPNEKEELVFIELQGDVRISVFAKKDIDYITEKEYFVGCLSG